MYWIIGLFLIFILLFSIWVWYHPESLLIPLNLLYRTDSSLRTNFYTDDERDRIFPVGKELEAHWYDIKNEGNCLYDLIPNKSINVLDNFHVNIGDENKKGWNTITLRLFGYDFYDYMDLCPTLKKILVDHPEIKTCLFSIVDPGKIIEPHVGPYDGILRYQLALDIPKGECYLHVGGEKYYWKEGQGVLFDENNLHGVVNKTDKSRMVLFIDIERPYHFKLFKYFNKAMLYLMGSLPSSKQANFI